MKKIVFTFAILILLLQLGCKSSDSSHAEIPNSPTSPTEEKPLDPKDFRGCKSQCLDAHSAACLKFKYSTMPQSYRDDFSRLQILALSLPLNHEESINLSDDSMMLTPNWWTLKPTQGLRVLRSDAKDLNLLIMSPRPLFKFRSSDIDGDYGGPVREIQFLNGAPILTTGDYSCVGFFP